MARKPADQTVDREDILWAAAEVIHRKGYDATTMKDIAAQVNLTAASLYHHFKNKDFLLLNVLEFGMDLTIAKLDAIAASDMPCARKLAEMIRSHVVSVTSNAAIGAAMVFEIRAVLNVSGKNGDDKFLEEFGARRDQFFAQRDYFEGLFRDALLAGIEAGEFRQVDADIVTKAILGAHNWVGVWFRDDGRLTGEEVADVMADTWLAALKKGVGSMAQRRSLTAWLPSYSDAQSFLRIIKGTSYRALKRMIATVASETGTPQSPVNWSDPGAWIPDRLHGDDQTLALRLWTESDQVINPRYCRGHLSICETHSLIAYADEEIALTDAGSKFLENDAEQLARMDDYDGILVILSEIAAKSPAQRQQIFDGFRQFCHTHTTWRTDGSVTDALRRRLENLLQRDLIEKSGRSYRITIHGWDYLERFGALTIDDKRMASGPHDDSPITGEIQLNRIFQLAGRQGAIAREQLENYLQSMDPERFEHLVARLYEAMGYDNVELTPYLQDQGVDIKADIEFGISSVHEVIQVKRQRANIGQPIVSQLRGAMPLFDAIRGSIVTTGGFSKKAKEIAVVRNAPPITLIDGERLLDLLIENGIGIRSREINILEFDAQSLSEFDAEDDPINE